VGTTTKDCPKMARVYPFEDGNSCVHSSISGGSSSICRGSSCSSSSSTSCSSDKIYNNLHIFNSVSFGEVTDTSQVVCTTDTVETPGNTTLKLKVDQSIGALFEPLGVKYGNSQDLHTMLFDDPLMGNCSPNVGGQIFDVQGKLKAASQFWVDVLYASPLY